MGGENLVSPGDSLLCLYLHIVLEGLQSLVAFREPLERQESFQGRSPGSVVTGGLGNRRAQPAQGACWWFAV